MDEMPGLVSMLSRPITSLMIIVLLCLSNLSQADVRKDADVVYGVLSGVSLAMDVYYPEQSLRRGIVLITGNAWDGRERGYTSYQQKNGNDYVNRLRDVLVEAGFTVFVPNTRLAPEYRFPAPVSDVRRAVRFIRHYADRFGIESTPIGAVGHSSGGYLAAMLGVLDDDPELQASKYPEERESSRVQAVVTIASPHDLTVNSTLLWPFTTQFLGERAPMDERFAEYRREGVYAEASTVTHISPDDAAFMLIHGEGDPVVPFRQIAIMSGVLGNAGLEPEVIEVDSDSHFPPLDHDRIAQWLISKLD